MADEKPTLIILPSWNPDEPRFIVRDNQGESDDRTFKNNKCVHNQRLGLTYSVDEIVEVLNTSGDELDKLKELEKENRQLKLTYCKCRDCKHANMYIPNFAFLVIDPKCDLNIKTIHSDSNACEEFQMVGRNSR